MTRTSHLLPLSWVNNTVGASAVSELKVDFVCKFSETQKNFNFSAIFLKNAMSHGTMIFHHYYQNITTVAYRDIISLSVWSAFIRNIYVSGLYTSFGFILQIIFNWSFPITIVHDTFLEFLPDRILLCAVQRDPYSSGAKRISSVFTMQPKRKQDRKKKVHWTIPDLRSYCVPKHCL